MELYYSPNVGFGIGPKNISIPLFQVGEMIKYCRKNSQCLTKQENINHGDPSGLLHNGKHCYMVEPDQYIGGLILAHHIHIGIMYMVSDMPQYENFEILQIFNAEQ